MKKSKANVRRILVVEDEPAISHICQRALSSEGFEVAIAENGASAREMLMAGDYDLCLVDIMTPVMNGRQLYEWISRDRPRLSSRVIFTTGSSLSGDIKDFLKKAGRPFILKPFKLDELKRMVNETLRQVEE